MNCDDISRFASYDEDLTWEEQEEQEEKELLYLAERSGVQW